MGNRNISQYFPMTNHVPGGIIKIIIDFVRIHFGEDFEKSFGKIQSDKVNHYAGENHFFQKIFLQDEQRNASIAHAVLSEFDYVCWIDLETQGYILYYSADEKTVVPQHSAGNFDQVIGDFNLQYIVPEEAEADKALYEPRKNGKNSYTVRHDTKK